MTEHLTTDQLLTIITNIVEKHGCRLIDIDLENHVLNIEGPPEKQTECAIALEEILG